MTSAQEVADLVCRAAQRPTASAALEGLVTLFAVLASEQQRTLVASPAHLVVVREQVGSVLADLDENSDSAADQLRALLTADLAYFLIPDHRESDADRHGARLARCDTSQRPDRGWAPDWCPAQTGHATEASPPPSASEAGAEP